MIISHRKGLNYNGGYSIEYDGKYIHLYGNESEPYWFKFRPDDPDEFDRTFLCIVTEIRNANPDIIGEDDEFIYIETNTDSVGTL